MQDDKPCGRDVYENGCCLFHSRMKDKEVKLFQQEFDHMLENPPLGSYDFTRFVFPGGISFPGKLPASVMLQGAIFKGETDFQDTVIEGGADFTRAVFEGKTTFHSAVFKGQTNLSEAVFKEDATFEKAGFVGAALFFGASFKGRCDFERASFKASARFDGVKFGQNASFALVHFGGVVIFTRGVFDNVAHFGECIFESDAHFTQMKIKDEAGFWRSRFKAKSFFDGSIFGGKADFSWAHFQSSTSFGTARFRRDALFHTAGFDDSALFGGTVFEGKAEFEFAHFSGNAIFERTVFYGSCSFAFSTFDSRLVLSVKEGDQEEGFRAEVDFRAVAIAQPEKVKFERVDVSRTRFIHTDLRRVDLTDVRWHKRKDTGRSMLFDEVSPDPKTSEFDYALVGQAYRRLRANYEENLQYSEAGDFYIGEMEMRRKAETNILKKVPLLFYKAISNYGESYYRPLCWIAAILLIFPLVFMFFGIQPVSLDPSNPAEDVISYRLDLSSTESFAPTWEKVGDYYTCFLYSISVFSFIRDKKYTTVDNWGHTLFVVESILSPITLAFFLLALRRRFKR
jgi:uncharacterized protein YjbI with pentapeptide repeats